MDLYKFPGGKIKSNPKILKIFAEKEPEIFFLVQCPKVYNNPLECWFTHRKTFIKIQKILDIFLNYLRFTR